MPIVFNNDDIFFIENTMLDLFTKNGMLPLNFDTLIHPGEIKIAKELCFRYFWNDNYDKVLDRVSDVTDCIIRPVDVPENEDGEYWMLRDNYFYMLKQDK